MSERLVGKMQRAALSAALLAFSAGAGLAQDDTATPGVNPKDNITKTEVIVRHDWLNQADLSQSLTLKFDRAFGPKWGANIEVPLVRFKGFGLEDQSLGDIQARVRYTTPVGPNTLIAGLEVVFPTAGEASLGRGQYLVDPVVGMVFPLGQTAFLFAGYKHFWSVGGDSDRDDVNESQPRLLAGYTSPKGWWTLADLKYTHSWVDEGPEVADLELEYGRMIGPATGAWIRVGTSFIDTDRDAMVLVGVRFIR